MATDARVTAIDLKSLSVSGEWTAPDTVTGIELSRDGAELYLSLADRVLVVDPRTLEPRKDLPVSSTEPIDHVAPALPPIDNGYVKCAC